MKSGLNDTTGHITLFLTRLEIQILIWQRI